MESHVVSSVGPSVLVVEDDTISRTLMCHMIARTFPHLTVHSAENGKDGLALFQKHHPKIVLTNVKMPEMNGISMMKEISSARSDVKFIVMTGYSNEMKAFDGLEVDYQMKPIVFEEVMGSIRNHLDSPEYFEAR